MSFWGDIKKYINSDLGNSNFVPIDNLILLSTEFVASDSLGTTDIIKSWDFTSAPTKDIQFRCSNNGRVLMEISFVEGSKSNIYVYNGDILIFESKVNYRVSKHIKIKRGDLISIKFENPSVLTSGGYIKIHGNVVNHYGLREVE